MHRSRLLPTGFLCLAVASMALLAGCSSASPSSSSDPASLNSAMPRAASSVDTSSLNDAKKVVLTAPEALKSSVLQEVTESMQGDEYKEGSLELTLSMDGDNILRSSALFGDDYYVESAKDGEMTYIAGNKDAVCISTVQVGEDRDLGSWDCQAMQLGSDYIEDMEMFWDFYQPANLVSPEDGESVPARITIEEGDGLARVTYEWDDEGPRVVLYDLEDIDERKVLTSNATGGGSDMDINMVWSSGKPAGWTTVAEIQQN